MKKQIILIFTISLFIAALSIGSSAKSVNRSEIEIDFDFVVRKQVFPAGKYSVERLNPSSPNFLILKQIGGKSKAVLMIQTTEELKTDYRLRLRFNQPGKTYFLVGIWAFGEKYALNWNNHGLEMEVKTSTI